MISIGKENVVSSVGTTDAGLVTTRAPAFEPLPPAPLPPDRRLLLSGGEGVAAVVVVVAILVIGLDSRRARLAVPPVVVGPVVIAAEGD